MTKVFDEFFDEFFDKVFDKFFGECFDEVLVKFLAKFLTEPLTKFLTNFLTHNLLTIASFRIGVPSILFLFTEPHKVIALNTWMKPISFFLAGIITTWTNLEQQTDKKHTFLILSQRLGVMGQDNRIFHT